MCTCAISSSLPGDSGCNVVKELFKESFLGRTARKGEMVFAAHLAKISEVARVCCTPFL